MKRFACATVMAVALLAGGTVAAVQNIGPFFRKFSPPVTAKVGVVYTYQFLSGDPEGDPVTYAITVPNGSLVYDMAGNVSWTPSESGVVVSTVSLSDGPADVHTISRTVTITVAP